MRVLLITALRLWQQHLILASKHQMLCRQASMWWRQPGASMPRSPASAIAALGINAGALHLLCRGCRPPSMRLRHQSCTAGAAATWPTARWRSPAARAATWSRSVSAEERGDTRGPWPNEDLGAFGCLVASQRTAATSAGIGRTCLISTSVPPSAGWLRSTPSQTSINTPATLTHCCRVHAGGQAVEGHRRAGGCCIVSRGLPSLNEASLLCTVNSIQMWRRRLSENYVEHVVKCPTALSSD